MNLVKLAPGINVRPDQVQLVLAQRNTDKNVVGFNATVYSKNSLSVGVFFDTAPEAEQRADEWARKINEAEPGPVDQGENLDALTKVIAEEVRAVISDGPYLEQDLLAVIRKHLGGEA